MAVGTETPVRNPLTRVSSFAYGEFKLAFQVLASTSSRRERPIVLLHALLFSKKHHMPLAEALVKKGHDVILLDLLGHGDSDRPADARYYSVESFAGQVVGLLDHLEIARAVIGGTSLGANVALEVAAKQPARVKGLWLEMPALEKSSAALALFFLPLGAVLSHAGGAVRLASQAAASLPGRFPVYGDVLRDAMSQDPKVARAVIRGLLIGRLAPPAGEREKIRSPSLIVGHMRDPLHAFSDAEILHGQLINSELVRAKSVFELRFPPNRLSDRIAAWLDEVWS
ncbi:MAG: alpha/beta fold hydrolase [Actinobacteria bacterium]|nr:alpha/beta fold hydrolase [Actinomycetota bacterium]